MMDQEIILAYSKDERKAERMKAKKMVRIKKGDTYTAYGAWPFLRSQTPLAQQRNSPPFME
jgi:hypothetical protein